MSVFRAALALTGLSQTTAAGALRVNHRTVERWLTGEQEPPEGVWNELAARWHSITRDAMLPTPETLQGKALARLEFNGTKKGAES